MSVIVVSLRKDLSIVEADGGESLNQQSAVAKASFEKDGVSCLPVNMFPPLYPASCTSGSCITYHIENN